MRFWGRGAGEPATRNKGNGNRQSVAARTRQTERSVVNKISGKTIITGGYTMPTSEGLRNAQLNKKDEFYTQLVDIEKEMRYYKDKFEGKTVYCNCDDPYESNFFKFFALNFNRLKLKKLISVSYTGSPIAGKEVGLFEDQGKEYKINNKKAYKVVLTELKDVTGDGREDLEDVKEIIKHRIRYLKGNGDFRSEESIELLKQADIVVTNPPFSLFRQYMTQLIEYGKQFIIIGNVNAITYKETFSLIKENKVWMGASIHSGDREFRVPNDYPLNASGTRIDEKGNKYIRVKGIRWYTNIDYKERHEDLDLYKEYDPEEYPKYDNYDAINVNKTSDIPCDYDELMGVPITYLDKHNPDQFEIIGMAKRGAGDPALRSKVYTKEEYPNYSDLNAGPVLLINGILKNTYPRILIKKIKK